VRIVGELSKNYETIVHISDLVLLARSALNRLKGQSNEMFTVLFKYGLIGLGQEKA
jgi:hypothetical protein